MRIVGIELEPCVRDVNELLETTGHAGNTGADGSNWADGSGVTLGGK